MVDVLKVRNQDTYDVKIIQTLIRGNNMLIQKNKDFFNLAKFNDEASNQEVKSQIH